MIETIVLNYLKTKMNVDVVMEYPTKATSTFLLLEKVGGGQQEKYLSNASFTIQSYAPSLAECAKLNDQVVNCIKQLDELQEISKVEVDSSYNFTDPSTKQYRYQALFDIVYY